MRLAAIIRAFRSEKTVGNFFVDMWRVVVYMFVPVAFVLGILFMQQGMPMTYQPAAPGDPRSKPAAMGTDDNGQAKPQTIVVGPVAAVIPIKMLGTNGGGFYGMNSAHPFEIPRPWTNFFTTLAMMLFPFSLVLMYGRMLGPAAPRRVIFAVMLVLMVGHDRLVDRLRYVAAQPGPDRPSHRSRRLRSQAPPRPAANSHVTLPAVAGAAGRSASRQPRRQRIALRHLRRRDIRGDHHRRHLRRGQLRTRQP